jgi:hypothetical protein
MAADRLTQEEETQIKHAILRAHEQGLGIAVGLLFGVGLFVATMFLVLKGGIHPGLHLSLLRVYFPGYSVSTIGACIGFVYAFVAGYAFGRTVATVYNRLVR